MKSVLLFGLCIITISIFLITCAKVDLVDPCKGVNYAVTYTITPTTGGGSNGAINITYPRGDTVMYSLNGGSYQTSYLFTALTKGNYVVTIKNQNGCTDTTNIIVQDYGIKYYAVKQIINGYCGPCHLGAGVSGGRNYNTDADIVAAKDRIKVRAVDGNPSFMPQGGQLTTLDKQKITDWIAAGGTTAN